MNKSAAIVQFIANLLPLYQGERHGKRWCARSLQDGTLILPFNADEDPNDEGWVRLHWQGRRKRATEALKIEPPMVPGARGGLVKNPWFNIRSDAARLMMAMGDRLGLDPKARAALAPKEDKPKSKFNGLIGQSAAKA